MGVNATEVMEHLRKLQNIMGQWEGHYSEQLDEKRTSVIEGMEDAYRHCSLMLDSFIEAVANGPAAIEQDIKTRREELPDEESADEEKDEESDEV